MPYPRNAAATCVSKTFGGTISKRSAKILRSEESACPITVVSESAASKGAQVRYGERIDDGRAVVEGELDDHQARRVGAFGVKLRIQRDARIARVRARTTLRGTSGVAAIEAFTAFAFLPVLCGA